MATTILLFSELGATAGSVTEIVAVFAFSIGKSRALIHCMIGSLAEATITVIADVKLSGTAGSHWFVV
jgi:hypothetical protein